MRDPDRSWQPFSVLVAGDAPDAATTTIDHALEANGYAVIRAEGVEETVEVACAARPDAVILTVHAPGESGLDACRRLCGDPRFPATTPVILLTDGNTPEAEAAYRLGAWDVCHVGPRTERVLLLKLQTFVRARLVSERLRAGNALDGETGVYSPAGLALRAREVEAAAGRTGEPVSCLALYFVAERGAADREATASIAHAAEACRSLTRGSDVLGRLDAAEFALIAPGADVGGAAALVTRMRRYFERRPGCLLRAAARSTPALVPDTQSVMGLLAEARGLLREQLREQGATAVPPVVPPNGALEVLGLAAGAPPRAARRF